MFDSRKQNPNCNFTEEIISYIYDEMKSVEKDDFETHLAKCSPCVDEIAAFSSVSFSIKEWRDERFAALETPQIEIPYETEKIKTTLVQTENEVTSWFDNLRELFNFSPALLKTATAFGTLALAIGLFWFLVGSMSEKDNAIANGGKESKEQKKETISPKATEQNIQIESEIVKDDKSVEDIDKSIQPEKVFAVNTPKPNLNRRIKSDSVKVKNSTYNRNKNKPAKVKNKSKPDVNKKDSNLNHKKQQNDQIQEIPRLTDFALEETEETDFRLTDFFDDSESGD